jgi:2-dehydro-3-deoxyphosphogluconate aldolase / (4S)-4-hydroxy-2-oxoglutarate aldolase
MIEGAFGAALAATRVLPVVVLSDVAEAVPLTAALVAGGLSLVEITLRTTGALDGLAAAVSEVPAALVGAGTVTDAVAATAAIDAGARFLVSPGYDDGVVEVGRANDVPVLPGVATATELMRARAAGIGVVKLFPAAVLGGVAAVDALAAVFPGVGFVPTGGVDATTAADYLAHADVLAVGGSWMLDRAMVAARDWEQVRASAAAAAALGVAS